ncbi:MAG: amylo-alpha-1,6-glucosidase [Nitrospiraceae bacterium]
MDDRGDRTREWLEADGLGGFASGTISGIRTRRYHALLLTATTPPSGRVVLVNGCDVWVDTPGGRFALSSHLYTPDVVHPDGVRRIVQFRSEPWPYWVFRLDDGTEIEQETFVSKGESVVSLSWRLRNPRPGVSLAVRPFLSGRDYHALHHENDAFNFEPDRDADRLVWHPYPDVPGIIAISNGTYAHQPEWYRNFLYEQEQARGLDDTEDLASPGGFHWNLSAQEAVLIFAADTPHADPPSHRLPADLYLKTLRASESERRRGFTSPLHRAADSYLVRTNRAGPSDDIRHGSTIIAGYPWFTEWGRDTFIAMRGLCLATGRLNEARAILLEWVGTVSEGMLPNRFADHGTAEFNAVDASLWYVIAVYEFLRKTTTRNRSLSGRDERVLRDAIEAILSGYATGTRFGIRLDDDGLLAAGQPGVQLTWMDAKVGDWVVTPRTGKPVDVQALWLNALWIGGAFSPRWQEIFARGHAAFARRFWNDAGGYLYDVIDCDHQAGAVDSRFRPNQIFAVGGLPIALLESEQAYRVVEAVERRLWTPMGLRSLASGEPGYAPHYGGGVYERDGAYHQGTVWPWLAGPFIEAWVRAHGDTQAAKAEARERFLAPLLNHVQEAGIGHISEIADAESPYTPRGCPFQAWSLGEVLRLLLVVLADCHEEGARAGSRQAPRYEKEKKS